MGVDALGARVGGLDDAAAVALGNGVDCELVDGAPVPHAARSRTIGPIANTDGVFIVGVIMRRR